MKKIRIGKWKFEKWRLQVIETCGHSAVTGEGGISKEMLRIAEKARIIEATDLAWILDIVRELKKYEARPEIAVLIPDAETIGKWYLDAKRELEAELAGEKK